MKRACRRLCTTRASRIAAAPDKGQALIPRLHTLLLLASVPLKNTIKGFGEGDIQLRGAMSAVKVWHEKMALAVPTNAPPDRRGRDIAGIMREVGLSGSLPYVKIR